MQGEQSVTSQVAYPTDQRMGKETECNTCLRQRAQQGGVGQLLAFQAARHHCPWTSNFLLSTFLKLSIPVDGIPIVSKNIKFKVVFTLKGYAERFDNNMYTNNNPHTIVPVYISGMNGSGVIYCRCYTLIR